MKKNKIKIGVIGSGAVGTIIATKLSSYNYDVEYVYDRQTDIEIGNMKDLNVLGETTPCSTLIKCINNTKDFTSKKDIIFLMCKSTHINLHIEAIKNNLSSNGFVVMLNNTLVRKLVTKHIPKSKIVGMFIDWSCEKLNDNTAIVTKAGSTMLGVYSLDAMPLAKLVYNILVPICKPVLLENFSDYVLGRVILNSTLACLGALCGQKLGDYLKNKYAKRLFVELIREGYCVYRSIGITPTDYDGKLDYSLFVQRNKLAEKYQKQIMKLLIKQNPNTRSSILKDLEQNKTIELDYLLGTIIETGRKNGIIIEYSEKVYKKIIEIKSNNDTIREDLLEIVYKGSTK